MKKRELTKEELTRSIYYIMGLLVVVLIVLICLRINQKNKEPEKWEETNYGDIIVSSNEEEIEQIPENIFDAYGLEYEYKKIPAFGFSTYVPVGWELKTEYDYIYFIAPDDVKGNYQNTEIAFCTTDIKNFDDKENLLLISNYVQNNIRNHNQNFPFVISTISNNQYVEIKDGDNISGYYCTPLVEFIWEDNPIKSHWSPYTVFYQIKTQPTTTTFLAATGPRKNEKEIDEIAKTIFFNTNAYTNTKFDFNNFEKNNFDSKKIKNMFFRVINNENSNIKENEKIYTVSTNPNELGYNCNLVVSCTENYEGELKDYLTEQRMSFIWQKTNDVYKENASLWQRKNLTKPTYYKSEEHVQLFGKNCLKLTWTIDLSISDNSRKYVNSIMPAMFTTYLIPDGKDVYEYTINYTVYQKYSANNYIDKVLSLSGFENN